MQIDTQEKLSIQVAMGWVMLLLVLTVSLVMMIVAGIVANDGFTVMRADPGKGGMMLLVYVFGVYAVMPIAVTLAQRTRAAAARWAVTVMSVLLFLFFFVHHLSHWTAGERPNFNSHFLEVAHHIIAVWVIYSSVRWARTASAARAGSSASAPVAA